MIGISIYRYGFEEGGVAHLLPGLDQLVVDKLPTQGGVRSFETREVGITPPKHQDDDPLGAGCREINMGYLPHTVKAEHFVPCFVTASCVITPSVGSRSSLRRVISASLQITIVRRRGFVTAGRHGFLRIWRVDSHNRLPLCRPYIAFVVPRRRWVVLLSAPEIGG